MKKFGHDVECCEKNWIFNMADVVNNCLWFWMISTMENLNAFVCCLNQGWLQYQLHLSKIFNETNKSSKFANSDGGLNSWFFLRIAGD